MAADLRMTIDGEVIEYDTNEVLADLTGDESVAIEEYLGGWENFRAEGKATRSLIVMVYLAKHSQGSKMTLQDVASQKGLMFGDRVDVEDLDDDGPPAEGGATPSTPQAASDDSGTGVSPSDTE